MTPRAATARGGATRNLPEPLNHEPTAAALDVRSGSRIARTRPGS